MDGIMAFNINSKINYFTLNILLIVLPNKHFFKYPNMYLYISIINILK